MFVKPSNNTPAALRKARWEDEQARIKAERDARNAEAQAKVVASLKK